MFADVSVKIFFQITYTIIPATTTEIAIKDALVDVIREVIIIDKVNTIYINGITGNNGTLNERGISGFLYRIITRPIIDINGNIPRENPMCIRRPTTLPIPIKI